MWIFTLPWTVAYLVYETSWSTGSGSLVVVLIVDVHIWASRLRAPQSVGARGRPTR